MLHGDVLLEIFDIYVNEAKREQKWHTLIHVCRKWRFVVFTSPHRLKLQLLCTCTTPVGKTLHVWPELPIVISDYDYPKSLAEGAANIIAALQHPNRVCEIDLRNVPVSVLERLVTAMQKQFQVLRRLMLGTNHKCASAFPDTFLAGSAPQLRTLQLSGIPFLGLPKLLLSTTNLVHLYLFDIPHSGYVSPEAMVTCLSALTKLKSLYLEFRSPLSRPDHANRRPPPLARITLPAISTLQFKGVSEYLENLVAQIDAPLLGELGIVFFHQLVFDIPQLLRFVRRTNTLREPVEADVLFRGNFVRVNLYSRRQSVKHKILGLAILCRESDWQLSSLSQLCNSFLPLLSSLEHVGICEDSLRPHWHDDMENTQWLELLQPFTAMKNLYLLKELAPRILPALQGLTGEGLTEVLPALQNIFIDGLEPSGHIQAVIGKFVVTGQLSGHPVAVRRCLMQLS